MSPPMPSQAETWHDVPLTRAFERLGSSPSGLITADANARLSTYGANILPRGKSKGPWDLVWRQVNNTLPLVLLGSGLLALAFGRVLDGTVVVAVVVLNAIIGALQE